MNKLLKIMLVALSLGLLIACGESPPSLDDRVERQDMDITHFTGTIEAFSLNLYQEGTHQIRLEDESVVVIQSPTINLNRYLGKEVKIEGEIQEGLGGKSQVFNVSKIALADLKGLDELVDYQDLKLAFSLKYPKIWQISEDTDQLAFSANGTEWVKINTFASSADLGSFVSKKEESEGDAVTIGSQKSLRFIDEEEIRIYIPNQSAGKVYQVVFNDSGEEAEIYKDLFYTLLENFSPIGKDNSGQKGDICGGEEDIKCEEGYRCELDSGEADAIGVCIAIDQAANDNCPFVPKPTNCKNVEVKSTNKNNCPLSYICLDESDENMTDGTDEVSANKVSESNEGESKAVTEKVTDAFKKREKQILSGAQADLFEVSEEQSLITVFYQLSGKEVKTVYSFQPAANEYNFAEIAHYEKNKDGKWDLKKGEEIEMKSSDKISANTSIDQSQDKDGESTERSVPEGRRLYENTRYGFSLFYHKNWYYRSFGSIENSVWTGGFNDGELEEIVDAKISVSIQDDKKSEKREVKGSQYIVLWPRDEKTHFRIEGGLEWKQEIDSMAESIQS